MSKPNPSNLQVPIPNISLDGLDEGEKFVAFLDVLGFKELVRNEGQREKLTSYYSVVSHTLEVAAMACHDQTDGDINLEYQLVSDSTIISTTISPEAFRILLTAIQTIIVRCAVMNIWIRGAITIGPIHFNTTIHKVVGDGLSQAYLQEQQERYPRVVIDPKIVSLPFIGTRTKLFDLYNNLDGTHTRHVAPLLHYPIRHSINEQGVQHFNFNIQNDIIFVAFCERLAMQSTSELGLVYLHIKSEMYSGPSNYQKYYWLKNYFTDSLKWTSGNYHNMGVAWTEEIKKDHRYTKWADEVYRIYTDFVDL